MSFSSRRNFRVTSRSNQLPQTNDDHGHAEPLRLAQAQAKHRIDAPKFDHEARYSSKHKIEPEYRPRRIAFFSNRPKYGEDNCRFKKLIDRCWMHPHPWRIGNAGRWVHPTDDGVLVLDAPRYIGYGPPVAIARHMATKPPNTVANGKCRRRDISSFEPWNLVLLHYPTHGQNTPQEATVPGKASAGKNIAPWGAQEVAPLFDDEKDAGAQ